MAKNLAVYQTTGEWPDVSWADKEKRWTVDARVKGRGERKFFKTREEAEAWAETQRIKRRTYGDFAFGFPQPVSRQKQQRWPFIQWAEKERAWKVDARTKAGGQRRFFTNKDEALGWAESQRIRRKNEGDRSFDDSELSQFGLTVADAIKFTLDHYRRQAASVPLESAMNELIAAKKGAGRSQRYCNDLRLRLGRLCAVFENMTIAQISTADLESFLARLNVAPETRNTFRRDIRTLWSFAEKRGWAIATTAKNTERAKGITMPPSVLTPEQAAALLAESKDNDLRAFHVLSLFAGLRVAETKALAWSDIDFAGGFIHVGAKISKTRSRRLVPILDCLRLWLQPIAKTSGPIIGVNLRKRHEAARERAGINEWPENCMRHSFCSYRLAATGNAAQTALESGHDQAVLFKHYREIVRPTQAQLYWQIVPTFSSDKILPIDAAA